jgi:hypothetical protein
MKTIGMEHTTPIPTGNGNIGITFKKLSSNDTEAVFETSILSLIDAIEKSNQFKSGKITLEGGVSDEALKQAEAIETDEGESGKNIVDTEDNVDAGAGEETTGTEDKVDGGDTVTDTTAAEATEDIVDNGDTVADTTAAEATEEVSSEPKVYALVKTLQDAKAVLISDFGVKVNALAKPANIRKKAAELGVEFPNLPADEA